jgi:exonuclease III
VLALTTLNVQATALTRARRLAGWMLEQDHDVWVLTETTAGPGTNLLLDQFREAGYHVTRPAPNDRGVVLASRIEYTLRNDISATVTLPGRITAASLDTDPALLLVGVYVPSSDRAPDKLRRKQTFIASLLDTLADVTTAERTRLVLCGDLNVITRDHQPAYRGFLPFEYAMLDTFTVLDLVDAHTHCHPGVQEHSWIGRTGNGYRFDYMFAAATLGSVIRSCRYDHEPRRLGLSDHAAVTMTVDARSGSLTSHHEAASAASRSNES